MKMTEEKMVRKCVSDLGISAYCAMHGFKFIGRKGRDVYFNVKESEVKEFEKLCIEYFSSACATFDMHLMNLKKCPNNSIDD